MQTKTNNDGASVFDYIRNHVKAKKITNGRVASAFWTKFWQEFDLSCDISAQLPQPTSGACDDIDEELVEAIEFARHPNPADRNPTSLVRYLEKAGMLSETALFGLLSSIQVGPGLARTHGMKLQVAALQYFARLARVLFGPQKVSRLAQHPFW